ncbi:MAG: hypothetical protein ACLFR0_06430 [Alphaproteobacteria bacterium]
MSLKSKLLLSLSLLTLGAGSAQADVFYWEDAQTHLSFTYPDRWDVRHNQRPDDIYSVAAPGANNHAICRLRVREDNRYAIYPEYMANSIQRVAYSNQFWDEYLAEYNDVHVHRVYDDAGLGRGFASFAEASYTTALGPKMEKRGIMFASLYNNKAYIVECSAEKHAYPKWHNSFLSLVKSVDFRKEINEAKNGYYRNFYGESLVIKGAKDIDVTVY